MSDDSLIIQDLKVVSSDNEEFLVPSNVLTMSGTIKNLLNDLGLDAMGTTTAIPLQNVEAKTLEKVIVWCTHHLKHQTPAPVEGEGDQKKLSAFAAGFFEDLDQTEVFEVILAANYLDIPCLLAAGCKAIANMMKGLSPQELRDKFEIVNDFTQEEQEEIRKQNAWCED